MVFTKSSMLSTRLIFEPADAYKNLEENLYKKLRKKVENKCTSDGYIINVNKILRHSRGRIVEDNFSGNIYYDVWYYADMYMVENGEILYDCTINLVNKIGIFAEKDFIDIIIKSDSDGFSKSYSKNQKINVEINNFKCNLTSEKIKVLGVIKYYRIPPLEKRLYSIVSDDKFSIDEIEFEGIKDESNYYLSNNLKNKIEKAKSEIIKNGEQFISILRLLTEPFVMLNKSIKSKRKKEKNAFYSYIDEEYSGILTVPKLERNYLYFSYYELFKQYPILFDIKNNKKLNVSINDDIELSLSDFAKKEGITFKEEKLDKNIGNLAIMDATYDNDKDSYMLEKIVDACEYLVENGSLVMRINKIDNINFAGCIVILTIMFKTVNIYKPLALPSILDDKFIIATEYNNKKLKNIKKILSIWKKEEKSKKLVSINIKGSEGIYLDILKNINMNFNMDILNKYEHMLYLLNKYNNSNTLPTKDKEILEKYIKNQILNAIDWCHNNNIDIKEQYEK